jgi:hypothetical protein
VRIREAPSRLLWNEAICWMVIVALFNVLGINTFNMLDVMKRGLCQSEVTDPQPQVPCLTRPSCSGSQGSFHFFFHFSHSHFQISNFTSSKEVIKKSV